MSVEAYVIKTTAESVRIICLKSYNERNAVSTATSSTSECFLFYVHARCRAVILPVKNDKRHEGYLRCLPLFKNQIFLLSQ